MPDIDEPTPDADELDPPSNTGLDPLSRELLREIRRSNRALAAQMQAGHVAIVGALGEVRQAVAAIDEDLDEQQAGASMWRERLSAGVAAVWKNDTMQKLFAGLGLYLAWQYLQIPPTPTPVVVAQPIAVEAATPPPPSAPQPEE